MEGGGRTRLRGVLASPFPGGRVVSLAVGLIHMRDIRHKRVIRVGICEQRRDRQQHLGNRQRGAPLVSEDVKANVPLGVDIRVVDLREEVALTNISKMRKNNSAKKKKKKNTFGGLKG